MDEALAQCDKRYDELCADDVCMKDMLFHCLAWFIAWNQLFCIYNILTFDKVGTLSSDSI